MVWFVVDSHAPISKPSPRRKRLFDVALLPLQMVRAVVSILMLVQQGRPIFYLANRMRAPG